MGPLIVIRVDASTAIGLGHVKRCLSLAHALRDRGVRVMFVARDHDVDVRAMVVAEDFTCLVLPSPQGIPAPDAVPHAHWGGVEWQLDAAQTVSKLQGERVDWVVVDHYAFDARWHRFVASSLSCRMAAIDDIADRALAVELLVDHNQAVDHLRKYEGRLNERSFILGGPRFALLGPGYAEAARYVFHERVRSIGIFMGGVDGTNFSSVALHACRKAGFLGPVEVASTSNNPHLALLRTIAAEDGNASVTVDLPELCGFLARHDLQIGAGGGATWERCFIGPPTLSFAVADNQRQSITQLAALGAIATLPAGKDPTVEGISGVVAALLASPLRRLELSRRAATLVDGLGTRRVALRMLASRLSLRPVTGADAELMHAWRNHALTRAVSRDTAPIDLDAHKRWLGAALADPHRHLLAGTLGGQPVGFVRFDDNALDRTTEVSLYLDPALHGLGLGTELLRASENWWTNQGPDAWQFVATVLDHNPGSKTLFSRAGYHFRHERGHKPVCPPHATKDNPT